MMADGKGCTCAAHSESECACDADWTPQEVYDLRAENERLREAIRRLAEQDATLSVCDGNVTVEMDATLTDAEREAIEWSITEAEATIGLANEQGTIDGAAKTSEALRGLLERLK